MKSRLAWVSLTIILGACASEPVLGGRYACVVDGGADQCPGAWRCGLEGYCHALGDVSVSWRCVSDDHCEKGWQCGLDESRDAGQCHDPAGKTPHPCFNDGHCTAGWHCGPAGRCYDRRVATSHACRFDAGDCADGWRCGLGLQCQDRRVGAAYACRGSGGALDDSWCEQGWRCAPEGRCVDPRQEALGQTALLAVGPGEQLHPLGSRAPIEHFALSPVYETGLGFGRQTLAWVQGGQLAARVDDLLSGSSVGHALGPWEGRVSVVAQGSRGAQGNLYYLRTDDTNRLFVALADGGVEVISLEEDGGAVVDTVPTLGFSPVSRLKVGTAHGDLFPRVAAFTRVPDAYRRFSGDRSKVTQDFFREDAPDVPFTQTPNNVLVDMVTVRASDVLECIFAVDRRGLWVSQQTNQQDGGPNFSYRFEALPVSVYGNDYCGPPAPETQRIDRLAPHGREWLGMSSTGLDGGEPHVAIVDLRPLWTRGLAGIFCTTEAGLPCTAGRMPVALRMRPCPVCTGDRILDLALVLGPTGLPNAEVRCGQQDGGTSGFFTLRSASGTTQCSRVSAQGESSVFVRTNLVAAEQPLPGHVAWASTDGWLWTGRSSLEAASTLFDRAATTVASLGGDVIVFTRDRDAVRVAGVGLQSSRGTGVVSPVAGEPSWVITEGRQVLDLAGATSVGAGKELALVGSSVTAFAAPYSAVRAQSSVMTPVLVVAAGTSIFSAEVGAGRPPIELRAVAPNQIDSLAFPSQAPAGVYLQGYLVMPGAVARVTAETATRWLFEEVPLPANVVPRETWFEGSRGRVGFDDGVVYSLPSRVQIAAPLGDRLVDYAQACGQQLALGSRGLYRLEPPDAGSIGRWAPLALPVGFADAGFAGGRLHGVANAAHAFTRFGEAARLTFENCPAQ